MFRRRYPQNWADKRGSLLFYKRGREPYDVEFVRMPHAYREVPEDVVEPVEPFEYQKRASFSF